MEREKYKVLLNVSYFGCELLEPKLFYIKKTKKIPYLLSIISIKVENRAVGFNVKQNLNNELKMQDSYLSSQLHQ